MRRLLTLAAFASVLVGQGTANAHIQMQSPTARYVQDNNGLKTAPCGSGTKTGAVTSLAPGQVLTVKWKESISHAGHYRIALAANDEDFIDPTSLDVPADPPEWVLVDGIQDKTGTGAYSYDVTIPDHACPTCVLQLLQVMSNGTDGTNTGPFSGVYHACADVNISAQAGDAGAGGDAPDGTDARADLSPGDLAARDVAKDDGFQSTGGAAGDAGAGAGGRGGAGGRSGSGGETGAGGATSEGGANGSGGESETGISTGSGGDGAEGGTAGNSTASGGSSGDGRGSGGSGSAVSHSGGASGSGGSSGTSEGSAAAQGCSCRMGAPTRLRAWPVGLAASLLVAFLGRRKRRARGKTEPGRR